MTTTGLLEATLSVSITPNASLIVHNESDIIWQDAVVTQCKVPFVNLTEGIDEKPTVASVRAVGVPNEIRTGNHPNSIQKHYRLSYPANRNTMSWTRDSVEETKNTRGIFGENKYYTGPLSTKLVLDSHFQI
jgi:hypothetical protein